MKWKVTLAVSGPITIQERIKFNTQKGFNNPFWTEIQITPVSQGVKVELIALADNQEEANEAALYFLGQALDYLSLSTDLPLYVSHTGLQFKPQNDNVKRLLSERDWIRSFETSRQIAINRRTFSRALSWYRKGMISEDPIDSFLSYWSSIESIASKFARNNERTQRGIINKICDCLDQLWGTTENWKIIPNQASKINEFHELRNGIAHGFISVDIETIKRISHQLPTIKKLSFEFLNSWEKQGINPEPRR